MKEPICHCGYGAAPDHELAKDGCCRVPAPAPVPRPDQLDSGGQPMWEVDGHVITDYTLRHQRGYGQHADGTWSRPASGESINSLDA